MQQEDLIAAISTPLGRGAIAIVRMSGKGALDTALKIFHCENKANIVPRVMTFGKIQVENCFEECLMVFFKAPYSFTGEDIVEFQIHGGILLAQKVLETCLRAGARLAEPGEFSKRAFVNGKITLDKAEAIIGEINAETEGELKSSLQITNGRLASQILQTQEKLTELLAQIEVGMDYPDETEETKLSVDVLAKLAETQTSLKQILKNSESAKFVKNGINVALVGRTNVGKSSVMNALLGEERAIVTDIQGTTRDQIVASFFHGGMKVNLIDTAGIRSTKDVVENMGIEKSKQTLQFADVVLFVLDGSEKKTQEDKNIEKLLQGKNVIYVVNKSDKARLLEKQKNEVEISALKNENIDTLKQKIVDMVISEQVDMNALVLTNERQCQILQEACNILSEILKDRSATLDVLAMQIKHLWQVLGKITGNTENEDIINLIFSKFCLGK